MSYDFIDATCPSCGTKFKRDPYYGTPCPKCDDQQPVYGATKAAKRAAVAAHNAEYEKRRAAEAKATPCPDCKGSGVRVKYHGGSLTDPNVIGLAMESSPCGCQAAEAKGEAK